jgi:hypothetical protein
MDFDAAFAVDVVGLGSFLKTASSAKLEYWRHATVVRMESRVAMSEFIGS